MSVFYLLNQSNYLILFKKSTNQTSWILNEKYSEWLIFERTKMILTDSMNEIRHVLTWSKIKFSFDHFRFCDLDFIWLEIFLLAFDPWVHSWVPWQLYCHWSQQMTTIHIFFFGLHVYSCISLRSYLFDLLWFLVDLFLFSNVSMCFNMRCYIIFYS